MGPGPYLLLLSQQMSKRPTTIEDSDSESFQEPVTKNTKTTKPTKVTPPPVKTKATKPPSSEEDESA